MSYCVFFYNNFVELVWLSCFIVRFFLAPFLFWNVFFIVVPSHAVAHVLHSSWGDCVVHGTVDSKIQELTRITSIGFDPVYR